MASRIAPSPQCYIANANHRAIFIGTTTLTWIAHYQANAGVITNNSSALNGNELIKSAIEYVKLWLSTWNQVISLCMPSSITRSTRCLPYLPDHHVMSHHFQFTHQHYWHFFFHLPT